MKSKEEIQYIQRRVSIIYGEKQRNSKETDLSQERVSAKHNKRRKRRDRGNREDRLESTKQQDQTRKRTRKYGNKELKRKIRSRQVYEIKNERK